jgi:hypothetical protein
MLARTSYIAGAPKRRFIAISRKTNGTGTRHPALKWCIAVQPALARLTLFIFATSPP